MLFRPLAAALCLPLIACLGLDDAPGPGQPDPAVADHSVDAGAAGADVVGAQPLEPVAETGTWPREMDQRTRSEIRAHMTRARLPGLAACALSAGRISWCGGFGLADVDRQRRVTVDTPFLVASVSKTVTVAAAMQLVEAGLLDLDADVSLALGMPIRHPDSDALITPRQLMTHTSGIVDDWDAMQDFYVADGDPEHSLGDVVAGYLATDGRWYNARRNFGAAPGTAFAYSNMGIALLGWLVEVVSGQDFGLYCREHLFGPLGMQQTSWRVADFAPDTLAMPYRSTGQRFVAYGHYSFADYPNGGLRASAADMARLLAAHLAGAGEGPQILEATTLDAMLTDQQIASANPPIGLVWLLSDDGFAWHDGGEQGVVSEAGFRRADGVGYVLLANGDPPQGDAIAAIRDILVAFASR